MQAEQGEGYCTLYTLGFFPCQVRPLPIPNNFRRARHQNRRKSPPDYLFLSDHRNEFTLVDQGVLKADGAFDRAFHDAGAAVHAFTRVHDDWMPAFFLGRDEEVALAGSGAAVAADAEAVVKVQRSGAAGNGAGGQFFSLNILEGF